MFFGFGTRASGQGRPGFVFEDLLRGLNALGAELLEELCELEGGFAGTYACGLVACGGLFCVSLEGCDLGVDGFDDVLHCLKDLIVKQKVIWNVCPEIREHRIEVGLGSGVIVHFIRQPFEPPCIFAV